MPAKAVLVIAVGMFFAATALLAWERRLKYSAAVDLETDRFIQYLIRQGCLASPVHKPSDLRTLSHAHPLRTQIQRLLLFQRGTQFCLVTNQVIYLCLGLVVFQSSEERTFGAMSGGVIVYLAAWAFQFITNVFVLYSAKNRSLLTHHVVEVQPGSFYVENPFTRSFHNWAGIAKVISRPGFVAVYVNAHAAHIIPNRAFSCRAQRNDFLTQVRAKLAAV
jgi:hypothetical protein